MEPARSSEEKLPLLLIYHGFPAPPVTYYLKWRNEPAIHLPNQNLRVFVLAGEMQNVRKLRQVD